MALDGTFVARPDRGVTIERASGEPGLYRALAMIKRTDAGIARAASRWGLLVRLPANIEIIAKQLGALVSARREEWLAQSRSAAPEPQPLDPAFDAIGGAVLGTLEQGLDQARRAVGLSDEDWVALREAAASADLSSIDAALASGTAALESIAKRHEADEERPLWLRELDEGMDLGQSAEALGLAAHDLGQATTARDAASAISRLRSPMSPALAAGGLLSGDAQLALAEPFVETLAQALAGREPAADGTPGTASARALVFGLLSYWRAADTPGVASPEAVEVPQLADPDTWRTIFTLAAALRSPDDRGTVPFNGFLPPERASAWRTLSIECAAWRDAIDALRDIEYAFFDSGLGGLGLSNTPPDTAAAGRMRDALWVLADLVAADLGLPVSDLAATDPTEPVLIRERLSRWIAARSALAGLEPRPRTGALGTEGRALLSICDAFSDVTPPRACRTYGCRGFIPPGSYAHRLYCDDCLRERARLRTARRRAAKRSDVRGRARSGLHAEGATGRVAAPYTRG